MLKITLASGGLISFSLAAQLSGNMTTGLMAGIFGQMDPDIIGIDYRDLSVAINYGLRLAARAKNCSQSVIHDLVKDYPSHDFIIDVKEASELFAQVEEPTDLLYVLAAAIGSPAYNEAPRPLVMNFTSEDETENENEHEMAPGEKADWQSDSGEGAGSEDGHAADGGSASEGEEIPKPSSGP